MLAAAVRGPGSPAAAACSYSAGTNASTYLQVSVTAKQSEQTQ